MTVVVNPVYESLRGWVDSIPSRFAEEGEVIYDARNQIRVIAASDGTAMCVKRFHRPKWPNSWLYLHCRPAKAVRAYENALRLCQSGIPTPDPVAYILHTEGCCLRESYLVCLCSRLSRNMYEFRHHPLDGYEPIVSAFARFTARMHAQGILHLDYSPGNILFETDSNGKTHFELVDINRMQFDRAVDIDTACRNFRRLWGKEDFFRLLAHEYAQARGFDSDVCIRLTIKYWKRFWRFRK